MKSIIQKKLYFCLLLAMVAVASCEKDEQPEPTVLGRWNAKKIESKECSDPSESINLEFTDGCSSLSEMSEICISTVFNADGTNSMFTKMTINGEIETFTDNGTYSINGGNLILCDELNECDTFTYRLSHDQLTMVGHSSSCSIELVLIR
jgi:hypothetical protein